MPNSEPFIMSTIQLIGYINTFYKYIRTPRLKPNASFQDVGSDTEIEAMTRGVAVRSSNHKINGAVKIYCLSFKLFSIYIKKRLPRK